jgi:hypothetical protein
MTHFLTNIFYKNYNFSEPISIETLEQWMLTSKTFAEHRHRVAVPPSPQESAEGDLQVVCSRGLKTAQIGFVSIETTFDEVRDIERVGKNNQCAVAAEGCAFSRARQSENRNCVELPLSALPKLLRSNNCVSSDSGDALQAIQRDANDNVGGEAIDQISGAVWKSSNTGDTFFWCVYLASQGDTSRLTSKVVAKEKISIINHIQAFPKCLKASSEKTPLVSTNDILFNFLTEPTTSPEAFVALCVYYKIRVMMICFVEKSAGLVYVELVPALDGGDYPIFIIKISASTGKYSIDLDTTESKIAIIRETGVKMETMCRPLKSISSYKVAELASMATRVGLVFDKKAAKSVIYEGLVSTCKWPVAHR